MNKYGERYSLEQKEGAIRLIRESGLSIPKLAKELGISESTLYKWKTRAAVDAGEIRDGSLTTEEKKELRKLRREVRTLRQERDFLKKAAAFFARETEDSSN